MIGGDSIESVLVTRHDKIGDFVLALPLCWGLKQVAPEVRVSVLVSKVNVPFARSLPFIDDVVLFEPGLMGFYRTIKRLANRRFDVSVSCFIDVRLGITLLLCGVARRVAPATKLAQVLFNHSIVQRRSRVEKTEWEYNLDLGRAVFPSLPKSFPRPLLLVSPNVLYASQFRRFVERESFERLVVFHPGSGGSSDGNLKLEDYLRLARVASEIEGVRVVFTFGPDDNRLSVQVKEQLDFKADVVSDLPSLWLFCALLHMTTLFVSTSTGPMHLAGAVNTKTLSFYGASAFASSRRWEPLNAPERQSNFMLSGPPSAEEFQRIVEAMKRALS